MCTVGANLCPGPGVLAQPVVSYAHVLPQVSPETLSLQLDAGPGWGEPVCTPAGAPLWTLRPSLQTRLGPSCLGGREPTLFLLTGV